MTDDNRALIENLHDFYRQLNDVYLKKLQTWMNIFIQIQNEQQTITVIKQTIDLKNSIQSCLKMIENYNLAPKRTKIIEKPGLLTNNTYQ
jgi:CRISPR/Cas system endoribonuclease Cas6 (RAMP superfamily)